MVFGQQLKAIVNIDQFHGNHDRVVFQNLDFMVFLLLGLALFLKNLLHFYQLIELSFELIGNGRQKQVFGILTNDRVELDLDVGAKHL